MSNAIKFTEPGGFVTVKQTTEGSILEISVSDTGCGMDRDLVTLPVAGATFAVIISQRVKSVLQNQSMCDIITKINRMAVYWKGKLGMSTVGCKSYYEYVNDQAMQYEVYGLCFVYSYKIRKWHFTA